MGEAAGVIYDDDWEEWSAEKGNFVHHMIAGSFAGLTEHLLMFPVDTYKVRCAARPHCCGSSLQRTAAADAPQARAR